MWEMTKTWTPQELKYGSIPNSGLPRAHTALSCPWFNIQPTGEISPCHLATLSSYLMSAAMALEAKVGRAEYEWLKTSTKNSDAEEENQMTGAK
jgi:hypothetical protein